MRFSLVPLLAAIAGLASAFPADIPIVTPEELDAGVVDASACYLVAYKLINCQGNVGSILGVPHPPQSLCIGVGPNSGDPRHSYTISAACPILNIYLYRANSCDGNTPVTTLNQPPGCYNIVSSYNVNSLRAAYAE